MLLYTYNLGYNALLGEGSGEVCALCNLNEHVIHGRIEMK